MKARSFLIPAFPLPSTVGSASFLLHHQPLPEPGTTARVLASADGVLLVTRSGVLSPHEARILANWLNLAASRSEVIRDAAEGQSATAHE